FAPERFGIFAEHLQAGFAKAGGGKDGNAFSIAPYVTVVMGDDVDACRAVVKPEIALY
ncbi:MAG: LLM class F420-dependent oxidoreductase, partial [Gammaproteobacteria bacterium]|nr:LLM class F420-dependent oxidoreductase [Gammaproteobacteria bacterium]NIR96530.1 LLM class F420-dependent oxidoreductase [Gammaproteobacteria bacterium]NIT62268.1 LLM class F420-dependent oxidoreductase [Gammaproteobacteria bacterium]NIV19119.1 LLM class F420-dependent oxidoreductase [Gammaproteobacteria bacterium]NIX10045.1 LLM class F420-dependent oxidoreductase [Gammaproteobacteria bacterium]